MCYRATRNSGISLDFIRIALVDVTLAVIASGAGCVSYAPTAADIIQRKIRIFAFIEDLNDVVVQISIVFIIILIKIAYRRRIVCSSNDLS